MLAQILVFEEGICYVVGVGRDVDESVVRFRDGRFLDRPANAAARGLESSGAEGLPKNLLAVGSLCWIQRWAAPLPELVADDDLDQSHLATKLKAPVGRRTGPGKVDHARMKKALVKSTNNDNTESEE